MLYFSFLSFLSFDKEIQPKAGISTRDKVESAKRKTIFYNEYRRQSPSQIHT
jgi:hypothetical protein